MVNHMHLITLVENYMPHSNGWDPVNETTHPIHMGHGEWNYLSNWFSWHLNSSFPFQQNVPERRLLVNMLQSNVVVDMMKLVFSGNRSSPPQSPQAPKMVANVMHVTLFQCQTKYMFWTCDRTFEPVIPEQIVLGKCVWNAFFNILERSTQVLTLAME